MTFIEKNFIILQKNVVGDLGKLKETASWWIEMVATQKGALTLSRYQETSHLKRLSHVRCLDKIQI
jgi:hypothetical protein